MPAAGRHLDDFVLARMRRRIEHWRFDGLVDAETADRLEASLSASVEAVPSVPEVPEAVVVAVPVESALDSAARVEAWADGVAGSLRRAGGWRPGWLASLANSLDETARAEREQAARRRASSLAVGASTRVDDLGDDAARAERARAARQVVAQDDGESSSEEYLGSALGSGQALFGRGHLDSLGGSGLEAVIALDEGDNPPRLNEYIWWFLGAVLVLGGSLMGVREAWRALGGVPRQLIVTGALLGYHAAFIGLGTFLARRSRSAGRVLASIGLALLPVVFIALSALVALAPTVGVPAAIGVAAVALLPLRAAGRLWPGASATSFAVALFPSLLAGLPLMGWDDAPWLRALCAFAGVVALGASLWRARAGAASFAGVGAALYGALWLVVFCVASAPSGFDALEPGAPLFAGLVLWAVALGAVVAAGASSENVRARHPRAAPVFETLAHAVVASGALAGALGAFSVFPGEDTWVDTASACAPVLAALVFFLLEFRRRALVHPAVMASLLAGALIARVQAPDVPEWWCFGVAAVASGLMLLARVTSSAVLRNRMLAWSVVVSLATMPAFSVLAWTQGTNAPWPQAYTGAVIAFAAHFAGRWRWRGLHYLGGVALLFGALSAVDGTPWLASSAAGLGVFALAAVLYGLGGLAQSAWLARQGLRDALLPLEDLSLVIASLGVARALGVAPVLPDVLAGVAEPFSPVLACVPTALASAVLLLRVRRDGSRLVSFVAAMGLALTVSQGLGTVADFTSARAALVASGLAFGFALFSMLRGQGVDTVKGRRLLDVFPLPFGVRGRPLFTDGFAGAALVQAVLAVITLVNWVALPDSAERPVALLAGVLLSAGALMAFVSRGFVAFQLRGSVVTLALSGGFIALTGAVNRAGRPLPPDVSAWRVPLIGIALWFLALGLRRLGPWVAQRMERPKHGPLYHLVPHLGVAVLAVLLLKSALVVGLPDPSRALGLVPPLLVLGPALLTVLLAASFRSRLLAHWGLLLGLPGAALWAAQQSLLGSPLVALMPPDGQWIRATAAHLISPSLGWSHPAAWMPSGSSEFLLWQQAFAGIAAAGLVYAVFSVAVARVDAGRAFFRRLLSLGTDDRPGPFLAALPRETLTAVGLVVAAAFFQPGLLSAQLILATGAVLFIGGARVQGRGVLGVGLLLLVHARAHLAPSIEAWPGPTLALLGFAVVLVAPWLAKRRGHDVGRARLRAHLAVIPTFTAAMLYALAVTGDTSPTLAVPVLVWRMLGGLGGTWMVSAALPLTLGLLSAALLVAAFQWRGALAGFVAGLGTMVAGSAVVATGMVLLAQATAPWRPAYGALFTRSGATLALAAAGSALALHVARRVTSRRRSDVAGGMGWGRDLWLVASAALLAAVALGGQASEDVLPMALAAIALAVGVSLHAAWREHTGRHVYFVQMAVVGVYALVRGLYAQGLRPEHDALFALSLGFVLVGVTVLARRAGVRPVEQATRRFAALLPIAVALILPGDATGDAALLAGGSGLLYAALGAVERSRMFGAFAAAACNLALLIAALAFGLEGLEVYLAPLGLLLLMMGQLFTSSLPHVARNAVRILGGLLLYVPAAAKLAARMGESEDGTYAIVFGAVCLLGVAVGMALRIRAYLALGTLFLLLDVVANLLDAGLRDHRIGFLVMTLTGLSIVTGRVMATLKRQEWDLLLRRVRVQLRGWD
ncbi:MULTISPECIES: hypothetical protein [unclassified Corallococcus]|uniref:hypothetical protein n=1 Tax=unclassified Corallococcus TaxID=2685029 RepID=UPI0022A91E97|nr:hypothetical protein [Corallococcus sp. NCRR]WAS88955.1 hypothetical protein O0N60_18730 [Corallococcus sp. NCRR]